MTSQNELNWNHALDTENYEYAQQLETASKLARTVASPAIEASTDSQVTSNQ